MDIGDNSNTAFSSEANNSSSEDSLLNDEKATTSSLTSWKEDVKNEIKKAKEAKNNPKSNVKTTIYQEIVNGNVKTPPSSPIEYPFPPYLQRVYQEIKKNTKTFASFDAEILSKGENLN